MLAILRWLLILGCFLGVVAHLARADSRKKLVSAEARRHLKQGNKLYNIRSFDQAIEEYKAGALIEEAPLFDYNLGQCFRQLGKYQEAIWHYERFINSGYPPGDLVDAANEFIAQMKSELEKKAMTQPPTEPAPTAPLQGSSPTGSLQRSSSGSGGPHDDPSASAVTPAGGIAGWPRFVPWLCVGVGGAEIIAGGILVTIDSKPSADPTSEHSRYYYSTKGPGIVMGIAGVLSVGAGLYIFHRQHDARSTVMAMPLQGGAAVRWTRTF